MKIFLDSSKRTMFLIQCYKMMGGEYDQDNDEHKIMVIAKNLETLEEISK